MRISKVAPVVSPRPMAVSSGEPLGVVRAAAWAVALATHSLTPLAISPLLVASKVVLAPVPSMNL
jgi:hypothetical protein